MASSTATTASFAWSAPNTTDTFTYAILDTNGITYASNITATTYTVSGLVPSTVYNFVVNATNSFGTSDNSLPIQIATTAPIASGIAPTIPTNVQASVINPTDITLTWIASTGTLPIGYQVQYRLHNTVVWITAPTLATSNSYAVTGLAVGTSYDFQISATNVAGTSLYNSTIITATTYGGVNLPIAVSPVLGQPTGSRMPISWVFGSPSATYNVYFGLSASAMTLFGSTADTSLTVSGLSPLTTYLFRVDAVNAAGTMPSVLVSGTTLVSDALFPPATPTGLTAVALNTGTNIVANWSPSAYGSLPISYNLRYRVRGTGSTRNLFRPSVYGLPSTWAVVGTGTVTANSGNSPDGSNKAVSIAADSTVGPHGLFINISPSIVPLANTYYTFSIYAQAGTSSKVELDLRTAADWANGFVLATYDLAAVTCNCYSGGGTAAIQDAGNGWYRCSVTGLSAAVPVGNYVSWVEVLNSSNQSSYAGAGESASFWGAQVEIGQTPSAYQQTTNSPSPQLIPPGYVSTQGNQFVDANGNFVRIAATNWTGAELGQWTPGQLWMRSYVTALNAAKYLGFNTIRITYSDYLVLFNPIPTFATTDQFTAAGTYCINTTLNPALAGLSTLQCWDVIIAYAGSIGLKVILAKCGNENSMNTASGKWYGDTGAFGHIYTAQEMINTQVALAARYANNPTVIGLEINNEVIWDGGQKYCGFNTSDASNDLAKFWMDCGNAIGQVNPNVLVLCQSPMGTANNADFQSAIANCSPLPSLNVPNKLVFSTHNFPTVVKGYADFTTTTLNYSFGYIHQSGIAPILITCGFANDFTKSGNGVAPDSTGCANWKNALFATSGYINTLGNIPPGGFGPSWCWQSLNPSGAFSGLGETTDAGYSLLAYSDGVTGLTTPVAYCTPLQFFSGGAGSNAWVASNQGVVGTTSTIGSLSATTVYDIAVAGSNSVYQSPWSPIAFASTGTIAAAAGAVITNVFSAKGTMGVLPITVSGTVPISFRATGVIPLPVADGSAWSSRSLPVSAIWNASVFGNNQFLAMNSSASTTVYTSPEAVNAWTSHTTTGTTGSPTVLAYGAGTYVGLGGFGSSITTSTDGGITWSQATIPVGGGTTSWYTLAFLGGRFLAIATQSFPSQDTYFMSSADGLSWTSGVLVPTGTQVMLPTRSSLAYGAGTYLIGASAGSAGYGYTSTDAVTWTRQTGFPAAVKAVAYGAGLFVAAAASGSDTIIYTSSDAVTWTAGSTLTGFAPGPAIFANNVFILLPISSASSTCYTSANGTTWTAHTTPTVASGSWISLGFGNNEFVAISQVNTGTTGYITSP